MPINCLDEYTRAFARYLVDGNATHLSGFIDEQYRPRLQVFRNGYRVSFRRSLQRRFKSVFAVLPESEWYTYADEYICSYPSRDTSLAVYGETFPEFLRWSPSIESWKADLAEIDLAEDIARSLPVDTSQETGLSSELLENEHDLGTCELQLKPGVRLIESGAEALQYWQHPLRHQPALPKVQLSRVHVLLWSNNFTLRMELLEPGEASFIREFSVGQTAVRAASEALKVKKFEVSDTFAMLLSEGLLQRAMVQDKE